MGDYVRMCRRWKGSGDRRNLKGRKRMVKKNRGNNRNRQIEWRRAAGAGREGWWLDAFYEHVQKHSGDLRDEESAFEQLRHISDTVYI